MEVLRCKTRIAVLWLTMAAGMSAAMLLMIMTRGGLEELIAEVETMGAAGLVIMAIFWLAFLILAVLSLTLKYSANRWVNFILGIVFGLFYIYDMISHLTKEEVSAALVLMLVAAIVIPAFIAWFAWKLPREEA